MSKKIIAGIAIYEIIFHLYFFIFEPFGTSMSASEDEVYGTLILGVPIGAVAIIYIFKWASK